MPSVTGTPAAFTIVWGEVGTEPARVTAGALALALTMGSVVAGPGLSPGVTNDLAAVTDTLFAGESIVDGQGRPTRRFQQIWQNTIEALVSVLTSQGASITELEAIYAGINTAQATAASAAQQALETESKVNLANSRTDPVDGNLTATSGGMITIAAHNRVYGDGRTVGVDGGSLSGFSSGDFVRVYYSDPARAGGPVTYIGTLDEVVTEGSTHVVGGVAIPEVGQPDQPGTPSYPPGYIPDYREFGI